MHVDDSRSDEESAFVRLLLWLTALTPIAHLDMFALFVVRARLTLGFWPSPYHPDPKDLGFDLHAWLFVLCWPGVLLSPVAFLGALLFHLRVPRRFERGAAAAMFTVTYAGWWWYFRADPGSFVEWFMD